MLSKDVELRTRCDERETTFLSASRGHRRNTLERAFNVDTCKNCSNLSEDTEPRTDRRDVHYWQKATIVPVGLKTQHVYTVTNIDES